MTKSYPTSRAIRHSHFVFAMAVFFGLAAGVGLSALLSPHDKSFDDCVAREMKWHGQSEAPAIRRICAKHHGISLAD